MLRQNSTRTSCPTDLAPEPVLCGINADKFENLCLATHVGGYEESDCLSKELADILANLSPPASNSYANGSTYRPVICTAASTTDGGDIIGSTTHHQEVFQNIESAKASGDYDDVMTQCDCYEFDELVYILSLTFGEENCEYHSTTTSATTSSSSNSVGQSRNDAQLLYTCRDSLERTNNEESDTRQVLGARLVANGSLGHAAIPDYLTLDLNPAAAATSQPYFSSIGRASLPTSASIIFRNDCTDYQRTETFLGLYYN